MRVDRHIGSIPSGVTPGGGENKHGQTTPGLVSATSRHLGNPQGSPEEVPQPSATCEGVREPLAMEAAQGSVRLGRRAPPLEEGDR